MTSRWSAGAPRRPRDLPRLGCMRRRFLPVATVLVLAIVAGSFLSPDAGPASFTPVSGAFPSLSGTSLTGETVLPADYSGKVVLVNFWASTCAPCTREQPVLEALWSRLRNRGVFFLGVDYRDSEDAAREHLRKFGVTYPSLPDPSGEIGAALGIPYLPATVIVDAEGEMRYLLAGAQEGPLLAQLLTGLLEERSPALG